MGPEAGKERAESGVARSERVRARILDAAEQVFGAKGYHQGTILDITRAAGIAQGTFYLYFPSKLDIFGQLVRARIRDLRERIRAEGAGLTDHRDVFRSSLTTLFVWIGEHPGIYRVWREAEFVDPSLEEDLYWVPARASTAEFARAIEAGEIEPADPEVLAWSLIGMSELTALRWIIWRQGELTPERLEGFLALVGRLLGAPG